MVIPVGWNTLRTLVLNWRGGLSGSVIFLSLWAILFSVAFLTVLGNDTPLSRAVLGVIGIVRVIAYPIWGLPAAYLLGARYLHEPEEP